jgi:hypothetical protein
MDRRAPQSSKALLAELLTDARNAPTCTCKRSTVDATPGFSSAVFSQVSYYTCNTRILKLEALA